jgi:hypothetical protein
MINVATICIVSLRTYTQLRDKLSSRSAVAGKPAAEIFNRQSDLSAKRRSHGVEYNIHLGTYRGQSRDDNCEDRCQQERVFGHVLALIV